MFRQLSDVGMIVFTLEDEDEKGRPGKNKSIKVWRRRDTSEYNWYDYFSRWQELVVGKN